MAIWERLRKTTEHVWKRNSHAWAAIVSLNRKSNKCVQRLVMSKKKKKKTRCSLFSIVSLILFLLSRLPTTLSLPQGRLIKTNAIVGYHCYARAQRAAGSYFSFSLGWWCGFVFFRNRFVSNGCVYLSSLPPFSLFPLCKGKDGVLWAALSHYLESADSDLRELHQTQQNFTSHTLHFFFRMPWICSTRRAGHK